MELVNVGFHARNSFSGTWAQFGHTPFKRFSSLNLGRRSWKSIGFKGSHRIHTGQWRYSSTILNLGTGYRWLISFTAWSFFFAEKESPHPLKREASGPHSRSRRFGEEKASFPCRKPNHNSSVVHPNAYVENLPLFICWMGQMESNASFCCETLM